MELRLLDEVMDLGSRGVALLCLEGAEPLAAGAVLCDERGNRHVVSAVSFQDGVYALHIQKGDAAYFERLFRDVRIDATRFTVEEDAPCP